MIRLLLIWKLILLTLASVKGEQLNELPIGIKLEEFLKQGDETIYYNFDGEKVSLKEIENRKEVILFTEDKETSFMFQNQILVGMIRSYTSLSPEEVFEEMIDLHGSYSKLNYGENGNFVAITWLRNDGDLVLNYPLTDLEKNTEFTVQKMDRKKTEFIISVWEKNFDGFVNDIKGFDFIETKFAKLSQKNSVRQDKRTELNIDKLSAEQTSSGKIKLSTDRELKNKKSSTFPWWLLGVVGLIVALGFMLLKGKSK